MSMLDLVLIWANLHRTLITLLVALLFWGLAYGIYFRKIVNHYTARGRAHKWQIDMVNKTALRGGRPDVNGGKRLT